MVRLVSNDETRETPLIAGTPSRDSVNQQRSSRNLWRTFTPTEWSFRDYRNSSRPEMVRMGTRVEYVAKLGAMETGRTLLNLTTEALGAR